MSASFSGKSGREMEYGASSVSARRNLDRVTSIPATSSEGQQNPGREAWEGRLHISQYRRIFSFFTDAILHFTEGEVRSHTIYVNTDTDIPRTDNPNTPTRFHP